MTTAAAAPASTPDPGAAPAAAPGAAPAPAAAAPVATLLTPPAADPAKPADPAAAKPGDAPGDPAAKPGDAPKPAGAPEKYADFTMPEGMTVDAKALESFSPILKGLNLSQENAQQLVTAYATEMQRQATAFSAQLQEPGFAIEQAGLMLTAHRDAWAAAIKADKDIGGANFDGNVQTAQRALAKFGTPGLKDLLNATGLGNHPDLVRMFVAVGKTIREDVPNYGASGGARKSTAEVLFGGSKAAATGA